MLLKSIAIFAMLFFSNISRRSQVFEPLGYFYCCEVDYYLAHSQGLVTRVFLLLRDIMCRGCFQTTIDSTIWLTYNLGMNTHQLYSIANTCRLWAEKIVCNNPDYSRDMTGFCAIAAGHVFNELLKHKYKPEIHLWAGRASAHCFVVVDDHVVDIAATQFYQHRLSPVVILHEKLAQQFEYYNTSQTFTTVLQLQTYQHNNGWPLNQTCCYSK